MDTLDTPDTPCSHPIRRHSCWTARDDTVPSGVVLCIACCDCGQVLGVRALPRVQAVEAMEAG
jgi:hypothetical protein